MSSFTPQKTSLRIDPATGRGQGALRQGGLPVHRARVARMAPLRACPVGAGLADRLREVWPGLMLRKFGTDEACAAAFGRRRQTGSNWRNGDCGPDAAAVSAAWLWWGDEMRALLTGPDGRGRG